MTTPEQVVTAALRTFDRDRGYVAPGRTAMMTHLMPRRPRRLLALIGRGVARPVADELTPSLAP